MLRYFKHIEIDIFIKVRKKILIVELDAQAIIIPLQGYTEIFCCSAVYEKQLLQVCFQLRHLGI